MSAIWESLLPAAMVGVERQAQAPIALDDAVGQLLREIATSSDDAALKLLRSAGVLGVCGQAGSVAEPSASSQLATPAATETKQALASSTTLALVEWALGEGPQRLQYEVFLRLGEAGLRLPISLLPGALEAGRRAIALRAVLTPVLGERGLWLARQNPAWQFAAGTEATADINTQWAEGSLEQRLELLQTERRQHPQAARERFAAALGELPARERAGMVAILETNLTRDDEALLDLLREDRSREVRQAAVALLVRLPESAHAARATTRIAALLQQERALLRKRWVIDAPQAAGADWKADGIEAERPKHESLGERAWWLYQLARQVPLAFWEKHLEMAPAALLKWAGDGEWNEALLRAWNDVALAEKNANWCEALLHDWPEKFLRNGRAAALAVLSLARREKFFQRDLESNSANIGNTLVNIMAACPLGENLSADFSNVLARTVLTVLRDPKQQANYWLRGQLPELYCVLHREAFLSTADIERLQGEAPAAIETLHTVSHIIRSRLALLNITTSTSDPRRAT